MQTKPWLALSGILGLGIVLMLPPVVDHASNREMVSPTQQHTVKAYGRLPLSFEVNQGQTDEHVRFLARGGGYTLFLTRDEAVLSLKRSGRSTIHDQHPNTALPSSESPAVLRMTLVGANAAAKVTGMDELPGKSNYFIGNDPTKWRTNVPNYAKVKYENIYPGVDFVYYGNQGQLEYDFVLQPGADPNSIQFAINSGEQVGSGQKAVGSKTYVGPGRLHVSPAGDLVVATEGGEVIFQKPLVYQPEESRQSSVLSRQLYPTTDKGQLTRDGGEKHYLDGRYVLRSNHSIAFQLAPYDRRRPVIIDPTLAYSTYLGGSGDDVGGGIAVDASGNAYVTGFTGSSDFPTTPGAFQTTLRSSCCSNAFVSKLNPAGSALLYSTYLGGSVFDQGTAIVIDASGNAYLTGWTSSSDFPTTAGAFQTTFGGGGSDAFVSKLSATGSTLLYSTYLGGSGFEAGNYFGIAVDASGSAYVTGDTTSSDFPTTAGAFQITYGGGVAVGDAFVSKLNATGSALIYATYLGGSDDEEGTGIAVDASGNAYVSGLTRSSNFPTTSGAFQTTYPGSDDAFVSKLDPAGTALLYSTYLGGSNGARGSVNLARFAIAVDASGNAYVTGLTTCSDFPVTPGAFQGASGGGFDAFVSKVNGTGSTLLYSTYLGGSDFDAGGGIAVDASGVAYVTGRTFSANFPTTSGAFQTTFGGFGDAFVSKLNPAGSALLYSTYLGGSSTENQSGAGIAIDASGNAYVAGETFSSDFPTSPGAFQSTFGGNDDAFVSKFSFGVGPPTNKAQCKNGEWKLFTIPRKFKNQGDCVSFVNTGK